MRHTVLAVLCLALALPAAAAKGPENLLRNGGFEKGMEGWKAENETGTFKAEIDAKVRAEGRASIHLSSTNASGIANDRLVAEVKPLPAGKKVLVSAKVKGKGLRSCFLKFFIFGAKDVVLVDACDVGKYTGTFGWQDSEREFDIPKDAVRAEVRLCMFLDGEAWFDDVRVLGEAVAVRGVPTGGASPAEGGRPAAEPEKPADPGKPAEPGTPEDPKPVAGEDEDGLPTADLRAGKDERKRYLLHGPRKGGKEPEDGWRLAVVMPGGPGTADFAPFVKNVLRNALSDDYLVAQPVAVKWTEGQEVVWPTKGGPVEGMKFTTEEFVDAVVEDVAAGRRLDRSCLFTLSWSSSGPAAYAIGLREKTPFTGSFIAMSVYFPGALPPRENAKGRGFYLYQSPQDDRCRLFHAEKARDELKKNGAAVELRTYEGGHGWHGDIFGDIRRGFDWLEKNHGRAPAK
jgi:predicted esterase